MNAQEYLTIIAQTENGEMLTSGINGSEGSAIGLDPQLGLVVLAQNSQHVQDDAKISVEILLDDMQVNLPSVFQESESANECMKESLENINEYLLSKNQQQGEGVKNSAVSLIAVQFLRPQCSVMGIGDYHCLLFHQDKLRDLLPPALADENHLGEHISMGARKADAPVNAHDVIVLLTHPVLIAIGEAFLRVTLSRFAENLDMAIRQINTRVARQGLNIKPQIIICRMKS